MEGMNLSNRSNIGIGSLDMYKLSYREQSKDRNYTVSDCGKNKWSASNVSMEWLAVQKEENNF